MSFRRPRAQQFYRRAVVLDASKCQWVDTLLDTPIVPRWTTAAITGDRHCHARTASVRPGLTGCQGMETR
jgi:hypothetical protein